KQVTASFKKTGLTGTLQGPDAEPYFEVWLDPQYVTGAVPPGVTATITYDQFGNDDAATKVTQTFALKGLASISPGYVRYRAAGATTISPNTKTLFPYLLNGSVTITFTVTDGDPTIPVRIRTDADAEQRRVSFVDLPYNFTTVGTQGSITAVTFSACGKAAATGPPVPSSAPPTGGVKATATATVSGGKVTGITITNPGFGYTSTPTITFSVPSTSTATATVTELNTDKSIKTVR